jgi:hypothetical protein
MQDILSQINQTRLVGSDMLFKRPDMWKLLIGQFIFKMFLHIFLVISFLQNQLRGTEVNLPLFNMNMI